MAPKHCRPRPSPLAWLVVLFIVGTDAFTDNLLQNAGFEEGQNGRAVAWDVFIAPGNPGAAVTLDGEAADGQACIRLDVPTAYPREPFNNVSQTVSGSFAGKTFRLTAQARVSGDARAVLMLQYWQQNPPRLLRMRESESGSSTWSRLTVVESAPPQSDLVVVRCGLRGVGTAWFDTVSLEETGAPVSPEQPGGTSRAKPSPSNETSVTATSSGVKDTQPESAPPPTKEEPSTVRVSAITENASIPRPSSPLVRPLGTAAAPTTSPAPAPMAGATPTPNEAVTSLTPGATARTLADLEKSLQLLNERIDNVAQRLERLEQTVASYKKDVEHSRPPREETGRASTEGKRVPPLIPHGARVEDFLK